MQTSRPVVALLYSSAHCHLPHPLSPALGSTRPQAKPGHPHVPGSSVLELPATAALWRSAPAPAEIAVLATDTLPYFSLGTAFKMDLCDGNFTDESETRDRSSQKLQGLILCAQCMVQA